MRSTASRITLVTLALSLCGLGLPVWAQQIFSDGFEDGSVCAWSTSNPLTICDVQFPLLVDPTGFFIETPTTVRIQARVLPPGPPPDLLEIYRLDAGGNPVGLALCTLLDNGNLSNGDDIAGDSVFSCLIEFLEPMPTQIGLRLAETVVAQTAFSQPFYLEVVDTLTEPEVQTVADRQDDAEVIWESNLAIFGDTLKARQETAAAIETLPGVAEAGVSTDNTTVWIRYESGVRGGLVLNPEGTRGNLHRLSRRAPISPADARQPAEFARVAGASAGTGPDVVGNNNVLVWDAYNHQFAPFDEGPQLRDLFQGSPCPTYTVTYLQDAQATVDSVRSFADYDTVILVTHGAVDGDNQVVFLTDEEATFLSMLSHLIDLALGRISVMGDVFAIRPSFISSLGGDFDNAIIYNGSCQSSANATMSAALLGKGAATYYGYTQIVNSPFAQGAANQLFAGLVTDQETTGDAFAGVMPTVDPQPPHAVFTQTGNANLAYSGLFRDGDFEKGSLGAWVGEGDARVVSQLGEFDPTEGSFMGLISTGLGFTTDSGTIRQDFCLPQTATAVEFDWNFSSEEFEEWCFQGFDDTFQVWLDTENAGSTLLFEESIDTLCGSVVPTGLSFDQSFPGCVPSQGNDCTVWSTGWLGASVDISAIAAANGGEGATLRLSCFDVGDSIFDSAILLDAVQVVVP